MICLIFGRRSGTSSMAKALYDAGFFLPSPLDLRQHPSQPQAGAHYENMVAREIDVKILKHFRMAANNPGLTPFCVYPELKAWMNQHEEPIIVKEPNVNMTWPVWKATAGQRPIVGIWCRRPKHEQKNSLVTRYSIRPDSAHWCVEMYEVCTEAARSQIPMLDVWLDDEEREEKAKEWLIKHGFKAKERDDAPDQGKQEAA